jgi:hypothetical protein
MLVQLARSEFSLYNISAPRLYVYHIALSDMSYGMFGDDCVLKHYPDMKHGW